MITMDDRDLVKMENDLKHFARRAYPFASKNTINGAAFLAQKNAREDIKVSLTLRNKFTVQSIQVEQARTLNVSRQAAIVGSIAPYMEKQQFGGVKVSSGSEGTPIATGYSAGQEGQQPRTKLPRRPNTMQRIQLNKRKTQGKTRKQRNLVAVKTAAQSGNKYVFLDLGRRKGIFRVLGGKRRPRIKMVWDLSRKSVVIPRNPWLTRAADKTRPEIPALYKKSLEFQLRRQGLFLRR